jgi:transposase
MITYIGLDAHSTTSTFVAINERGKEIFCAQVPTNEKSLQSVLRSIKGQKQIAFEESNLSRWLYVCLKSEADRVVVCASQYFRKKPGAKTDAIDGRYLAEELRHNNLVEVYRNDVDELLSLRGLVSAYDDIVRDLVRCKNRFKALFRSQAILTSGSKIYSDAELIQQLSSPWDQFSADALMYQIGMLEECKKRYFESFNENVKKYKAIKLLTTIPGIDVVRANQIAAITCDAKRFKNKHHYWSYCMLVKHKQISNMKVYGQRYAYGRSELKNIYMGCALNQMSGSSAFRRYYDQLLEKGITEKNARKALARKSAAVALAVMRTERKYDDNWEKKKTINKK